jgi:hypothetical protein
MRNRPKKNSPPAVMPNRFLTTTIFMLSALGGLATAAVAPMSPEELRVTSTHILKGKVLEVRSRIEKSQVERAFGLHRDRVFTVMLQVTAVSKGKGVKQGEKVVVTAWRPTTRIPPIPGPQGHSPIPEKGQVVTVYVASKKGVIFVPIMPNGIRIEGPEPVG